MQQPAPRHRLRSIAVASAVLALLAALSWERFPKLERSLRRPDARSTAFGSKDSIRLLTKLGSLQLSVPPNESWELPSVGRIGLRHAERTIRCGSPLYGTRGPAAMSPSTTLLDWDTVPSNGPVLSLAMESCRLQRLMEQPFERGREWEEPAFVSFFDRERLVFSGVAGVRVHGFGSRRRSRKNYRLYFRRLYGDRLPPAGLASDPNGERPREFVLKTDDRESRRGVVGYFINALAYDVARRVSGFAPHTQPVNVFLNGQQRRTYLLTERINELFMKNRFGHDDFEIVRNEIRPGSRTLVWRTVDRWARSGRPFKARAAERLVDLDNLARWFVVEVYCATADGWQSTLARDLKGPDRRWFWIHWDLDRSFLPDKSIPAHAWERNVLGGLVDGDTGTGMLSGLLLRHLLLDSQEFRQRWIAEMTSALNHTLTPEYMDERLNYYEELAGRMQLEAGPMLEELSRFARKRPAFVRTHMREVLGAGEEITLVVEPGAGGRIVAVDGFPKSERYEGHYFVGMQTTLEIPEDGRASFSHWRIGSQRREGPVLELELRADLEVSAVFKN